MKELNKLITQINDLKGDKEANYNALKAIAKQLVGNQILYINQIGKRVCREVLYNMEGSLIITVLDDDSLQKFEHDITELEIKEIFPIDLSAYQSHSDYLKKLEETRRELLAWRVSELSPSEQDATWYKFAEFYG